MSLDLSQEINELAEAVANSLESPPEIDIEEWANNLANQVADLVD